MSAPSAESVLRYPDDHWSHWDASDAALAKYLALNDKAYNHTKTAIFERLLGDDLSGRSVLDYGGGAGFLSVLSARRGARATLVDAEPQALEMAKALARRDGVADRVETLCARSIPPALDGHHYDVVIVKDVVEHVPDDAGLIAGFARHQPAGGRLLLSTQNSLSLNYVLEGAYRRYWCGDRDWCGWDPTHLRFYTPRSLRRLLAGAGYRITDWWGMFIVPYNLASWFTLLRRPIEWPWLHQVDLRLGGVFPFNRLGWNIVLAAERR